MYRFVEIVYSCSCITCFIDGYHGIIHLDTREGASLYQFAQTVNWPAEETTEKSMALQSIDCM